MVGNCGEGWRHKEGSLLSSSTKGVPFLTAGNIFVDLLLSCSITSNLALVTQVQYLEFTFHLKKLSEGAGKFFLPLVWGKNTHNQIETQNLSGIKGIGRIEKKKGEGREERKETGNAVGKADPSGFLRACRPQGQEGGAR